jgi:ribosomal protein L11 methyltransferase
MKQKSLWRISVTTTREAEDAVTELLGSTLGQPVSSHFNVGTRVSTVTVYGRRKLMSQDVRGKISAGLKQIKNCGLKIGSGTITIGKVRRENWATSWKRHFKPIGIGDALLIKPSWSKRKLRKGQIAVILDPGLSFGTGQHPTTMFCLGEIVKWRAKTKSQSFLDLGTGSGILAIAAAKLGYQPVHAIDFDPEAVRVARANARTNRIHKKLRIVRGDVTKFPLHAKRRYDLICANLISNLLIAEKQRIVAHLNRRGRLVLAGILKREFAQVRTAFGELDLKLLSSKGRGEWRSGSFCFVREKSF